MEGAARADEDDARALALGERLKAWFGALSRRPVPERLIDHVDALERGERPGGDPAEPPAA